MELPRGQQALTRGLRRLFDLLATSVILADEVGRHVPLLPRIVALPGRAGPAYLTAGCQG